MVEQRFRKLNTFVSPRSSRYAGDLIPPGRLSVLFADVSPSAWALASKLASKLSYGLDTTPLTEQLNHTVGRPY